MAMVVAFASSPSPPSPSHCPSSPPPLPSSLPTRRAALSPSPASDNLALSPLPFASSRVKRAHGLRATRPTSQGQLASEMEARELQEAKFTLLRAVQDTERGLLASGEQRASIEEAMVAVEAFDAGVPLDLNKLDGTWLLQYTTAADVLSIFQTAQLPVFKVGQVFQKFECVDSLDGGVVRNVVRWSVPGVFQENDGATLTVTAQFYVVSARNIGLQFEEASIGSLLVSEELQALLAPALLPRTFLNLELLQFIRNFDARIPLRRGDAPSKNARRLPLGLLYYLSFLDKDMLLGRALGSGGIFIFSRTQPLQIN